MYADYLSLIIIVPEMDHCEAKVCPEYTVCVSGLDRHYCVCEKPTDNQYYGGLFCHLGKISISQNCKSPPTR